MSTWHLWPRLSRQASPLAVARGVRRHRKLDQRFASLTVTDHWCRDRNCSLSCGRPLSGSSHSLQQLLGAGGAPFFDASLHRAQLTLVVGAGGKPDQPPEDLGQQAGLDPLLSLLTLPVLPEAQIQSATQQILGSRPDLLETVASILMERFPLLTRKEIMEIATIPAKDLRHTRAAQEWIAEGRFEGEAVVALRLLNRRCGPLSEATTSRIHALPLEQLEALTEALLDFSGPADLAAWLGKHGG